MDSITSETGSYLIEIKRYPNDYFTAYINGRFALVLGEQHNGATFLRGILEQWFGCEVWRFPDRPDFHCSYKACFAAANKNLYEIKTKYHQIYIMVMVGSEITYKEPLPSPQAIEDELDAGFESALDKDNPF